jgi:hypothetical protein
VPQAFADERAQHAGEALLGDAEDGEQLADGQVRLARDPVQGAVMRAAIAEFGQNGVRRLGKVAQREEDHVLRQTQLFLPQEEQPGTGLGVGKARGTVTFSAARGLRCSVLHGRIAILLGF